MKFKICFLLPLLSSVVKCGEILPFDIKKYETENPEECSKRNGTFCKISINLIPLNNSVESTAWKIIQEANGDYRYFDRAKLLHGRCFRKQQMRTIGEVLQEEYATKFQNESLQAIVDDFKCFEKSHLFMNDWDYWDLFFLSIVVIYLLFMISSTFYTHKHFVDREKGDMKMKILSIFSFVTIWKELNKPKLNEDFEKLKSIQGLRTLTMMLIISLHAFYGNIFNFLKNPEYVEMIYLNVITRSMVTIFSCLVQTFFVVSAWLLTIQVINVIKKNGDFTLKDVFLIGMNRYFRLVPVLAVFMMTLRSKTMLDVVSYIYKDIAGREVSNCRYYWWKNLLFIQNFYEPDKMCSGVTWYLATDFQLYLWTLLLFYVSNKTKIARKHLIGLTIVATIAIQVGVVLNTSFQGIMRPVPKTANLGDLAVSNDFIISYIPPWCHSITYMIGVIFGTLYSEHKNKQIIEGTYKKTMWFLGFFGAPMLALFVTSFQYENRIFELLVSILARPMFGIGMAIGIMGMATGTGGLVKRFLELQPLVFLANFCYCVYLTHFLIMFSRILRIEEMVDLSLWYIAKYTLIDYVCCFSVGAVLYITIEHPLIQLQKLMLPQVKLRQEVTSRESQSLNVPLACSSKKNS